MIVRLMRGSEDERRVQIRETVTVEGRATPQMHGGWSVGRVPPEWDQPGARNSRVIEVSAILIGVAMKVAVNIYGCGQHGFICGYGSLKCLL